MESEPNFLDVLLGKPLAPSDRFRKAYLLSLFHQKIARSRATGKDGIRVGAFQSTIDMQVSIIERKILNGTFNFTPYKERLILRGAIKAPRQISIPTVRDRLVLRAVCQILHETAPPSIGPSPHKVVDSVAKRLRSSPNAKSFIRIDVKDFFPSIRHDILEFELRKAGIDELTLNLCLRAVATTVGDSSSGNGQGVPQGLSISGALAEIFMLRFDRRQLKRHSDYFRYVDDILIISETSEADRALATVRKAMARIGLTIHPPGTTGKTEITSTDDGIDYLGYNITRDRISVRKSSFRRMFKNISKVTTDFRFRGDLDRFLFRINLKITGCIIEQRRRGWLMFFSRTENMRQLSHLDNFVKNQARSLGLEENHISRIKRFVKSYHEINYNISKTQYIPNFDNYSSEQKSEVVAVLSGRSLAEVNALDIETIEMQFGRLLGKEVRDLEQDVGNPS